MVLPIVEGNSAANPLDTILDAVVARLAVIGTSASYLQVTAPIVSRNRQFANAPPLLPAAWVGSKNLLDNPPRVSMGAGSLYSFTFTYTIVYWANDWDTDKRATDIVFDVFEAMKDWKLGTTCDDNRFVSADIFTSEQDETRGGVEFTFTARFRVGDQAPLTRV